MSKKIKVRMTESFNTFVSHEPIELDLSEYPELEGMDYLNVMAYIMENASEMKAPNEYKANADNLFDVLYGKDVVFDKIIDETTQISFE